MRCARAPMIVLSADRLYTPLQEIRDPLLFLEDGRISEISSRAEREIPKHATVLDLANHFPGAILAPGFIDIHMHGGAGLDVMRAAPAGLADAIEAAQTSGNADAPQAHPIGIHLEGPFLSHKRRGVHPPEYLVEPTVQIFDRLWQAARGHVRMMTIAPELPGALEVIAEAARRKVCVSIGHSDAVLDAARAAVHAGAGHATHTFNAMRPLDHRDPGILGEVLTDT